MEAVKGLTGNWHLTDGEWDNSGNKLKTYCKTSISPNYRRVNESDAKQIVTCTECKEIMQKISRTNKGRR